MKIKLSKYVAKIDSAYMKTREEYEKLMDKLVYSSDYHNVKMRELNPLGRNRELERFQQEQKQLQERLMKNQQEFDNTFSTIRSEVEKTFRPLYVVIGEKVDTGVVEILKTGIMTDSEMVEQAKHYLDDGNMTMARIIGRYAGERVENLPKGSQLFREMSYIADIAKHSAERSDLELIDRQKTICDMALRLDRVLADGIHYKVYDVSLYLQDGEQIAIDIESPFDE